MGKFIGGILLLIFFFTIGWRYVPQSMKEHLSPQFAGVLGNGRERAVEIVKTKLLPQNPREQREVLLASLKKNIGEIKERAIEAGMSDTKGGSAKKTKPALPELIAESEQVIHELEKVNGDISLKEKITEKVLNAFASEKEVCEVKK